MKHTEYYLSGQHKKNAILAGQKAIIASAQIKQNKISLYNVSPAIVGTLWLASL